MKSARINLRGPVYRYNADTCQYERAGISWPRTILYLSGLLLTSVVLLGAMLVGYDAVVESDHEKVLHTENTALVRNTAVIKNEIALLERTLNDISSRDHSLHHKFFSSTISSPETSENDQPERALDGDYSETQRHIAKLQARSDALIKEMAGTNTSLQDYRVDMKLAATLPTDRPIANMTADDIVSGFGMRINPFHKALYNHDGLDIMAVRGTSVLSAGPGRVVTVKHNSVEAGFGNYIEIDHENGFVSRYAHLQDILVRKGSTVTRGAVIATTGRTGGAIAPHLHYEILYHGKNVDPVRYMINGLSAKEFEKFLQVAGRENQSLD